MRRLYFALLRGLAANAISRIGVFLTTSAFILFVLFFFATATGWLTNAYLGLISYMALPGVFIVGLLLIPWGWRQHSKKTGRPFSDLFASQFSDEDVAARKAGAPIVRVVLLLTLVNLVFMGVVGTSTVHFMDSAHFCGTACHDVMNPEWMTYQGSPHAHVKCVECHVGEGLDALFLSKLNGAWQVVSATFDLYERPIPTPVHNLRPARETCEHCHWPDKFHGNRIANRISFKRDSTSTPMYTTLMLKIGSGAEGNASGSHWHVAETNAVRYSSIEDERKEMLWVEVRQDDGTWKRYTNTDYPQSVETGEENVRVMDCVDCHNRATHIYEEPDRAIDDRMAFGQIDRSLPYIKRKALEALTGSYADKEAALQSIETSLHNYYQQRFPEILPEKADELDQAIATLQQIYDRNIHPHMNIEWGAYESYLGHRDGPGCFRCHDPALQTAEGESIPMDCTLCHSILADESAQPFAYLQSLDLLEPGSEKNVQSYFQDEFWDAVVKEQTPE